MILVPPTLHPDGFNATRSTDEQFLDLLCPTRICSGLSSTRSSPRNGQVSHRAGRAEAPVPSDVPAGHGEAARELQDLRGGHALYGSAAGRGNAHLRARPPDLR